MSASWRILYQPSILVFKLEWYTLFLYFNFLTCSHKTFCWNSLKIWMIYLNRSAYNFFLCFCIFPIFYEFLVIGKCHRPLVTRCKMHLNYNILFIYLLNICAPEFVRYLENNVVDPKGILPQYGLQFRK